MNPIETLINIGYAVIGIVVVVGLAGGIVNIADKVLLILSLVNYKKHHNKINLILNIVNICLNIYSVIYLVIIMIIAGKILNDIFIAIVTIFGIPVMISMLLSITMIIFNIIVLVKCRRTNEEYNNELYY